MARRLLLLGAALSLLLAPAAIAQAGVTGPAFYVDGELYRTVATPTDLSNTGAPDHSFDTIYEFFGVQTNVATAAPGDRDYNGGRWRVIGVEFSSYEDAVASADMNGSGDLDSDAEVEAALAGPHAESIGVVKQFVCPAIPLPRSGR